MSEAPLNCWHCGESLTDLPLPFGRRAECPQCTASLHVCRQCEFYDRGASKDCREPMADEVSDKEAANFCDYFRPRGGLSAGEDRSASESRAKLAALFDGPSEGPGRQEGSGTSPEEEARRKLDAMFGGEKEE